MDFDSTKAGDELVVISKENNAQTMKVYTWNTSTKKRTNPTTYNNIGLTLKNGNKSYEVAGGKLYADRPDEDFLILKAEGFNKETKVYSRNGSAWTLENTYSND